MGRLRRGARVEVGGGAMPITVQTRLKFADDDTHDAPDKGEIDRGAMLTAMNSDKG